MLRCLLVTLQSPFLVTCCVCVVPESDSSGDSASGDEASCCGPASPEDTHQEELGGHSQRRTSVKLCCIWLFMFLIKRRKLSFCPLKIMLDLPGYFKIKQNLLHCILEMHFKYLLKEDSCIQEIQKRREYYFQRV